MQLEKASRMLGEENVRIKQLDHANKGLEGQLAKKLSTLETLKSELKDELKLPSSLAQACATSS